MNTQQRLDALRAEFENLRDECQRIDTGGTLTREAKDRLNANTTRIREITSEIEALKQRQRGVDAGAAVVASINAGSQPIDLTERVGDLAVVLGRGALGARGNAAYLGDVETMTRALQHGVVADGISLPTVEGDLVNFVDANRYAVNGARALPLPQNHAKTFERPRVTQRTQVGTQSAEGDVLASRRLQTTGDVVTKVTKGGTLALSEQEVDWTDPAMLGLAIQDLAEQYAIDTDDFLCTAIEAGVTTNNTDVALDAAAEDFNLALAEARGAVYATSKKLPDVLFAGTNRWTYLLGLTDADGRPLYDVSGASVNAPGSVSGQSFGGNVGGLRLVVDPNFDADFLAVGVSSLVEFYEQRKGLISVDAPTTLEVIYSFRGYVAANVYAQGLQGLGPDA